MTPTRSGRRSRRSHEREAHGADSGGTAVAKATTAIATPKAASAVSLRRRPTASAERPELLAVVANGRAEAASRLRAHPCAGASITALIALRAGTTTRTADHDPLTFCGRLADVPVVLRQGVKEARISAGPWVKPRRRPRRTAPRPWRNEPRTSRAEAQAPSRARSWMAVTDARAGRRSGRAARPMRLRAVRRRPSASRARRVSRGPRAPRRR